VANQQEVQLGLGYCIVGGEEADTPEMPRDIEVSRARDNPRNPRGNQVHQARSGQSRSRRRIPSGFTYISGCVKYTMFLFNFLFWLVGALLIAVGTYAVLDRWSSGEVFRLETIFDILFNVGFLLIIVGGIVFIVSFAGCIGALRENMCLLRFYSLFLLLFFLGEMVCLALGFIYPHKMNEFLEDELSDKLIERYRDDLDFQNLIDLIQSDFHCCGLSSKGYRDWSKNEYFNCTINKEDNPSVERCGVPYSCCHQDDPAVLINYMCGFQVQGTGSGKKENGGDFRELPETEALEKVNVVGCLSTIQGLIEANLYPVAGIAIGIALSQLLVIWLARTLEGQIEAQRSLWVVPS